MTIETREAIRKLDAALDFVEAFVSEVKGDLSRSEVYTRARDAQKHEPEVAYP